MDKSGCFPHIPEKKKSNHVALIVIIIGKTQNPLSPIFLELRVVGYRLAIFLLGV